MVSKQVSKNQRTSQGANPLGGSLVVVNRYKKEEYLPCKMCGKSTHRSDFSLYMSGKKSGQIHNRRCKSCRKIIDSKKRQTARKNGNLYSYGYLKHRKSYCEDCGFTGHFSQLEVHHVDRNHKNNNPKNLKTLCANCHRLQTFIERGGTYGL